MGVLDEIRAALAQAPTQHARQLVLHTPLGRDVLLAERARIHEAIVPSPAEAAGAGFRLEIEALAADTHLALKQLVGQPVLLELLTAHSRSALRPFHGHVTEAALLGSDGGLARYRLVVEPWLALLRHRVDSWVFQDTSVRDIVEEVFADHAQAKVAPAWRWELADASVYARRSLCIQYQESDLDFVLRLLREEGLVAWFEHEGAAGEASLGRHVLVIADHNGAFTPNAQPRIRFTQSSAVIAEDSMTRWRRRAAVHTAALQLASRDYRSRSLRPQSQRADPAAGAAPLSSLELVDVPGLYAYEDEAQGARLALRQMQALDAQRERFEGRATVRTLAPGRTFTLADHAVHDGSDDTRDRFVVLGAEHVVRSNLRADHQARLDALPTALARLTGAAPALPNDADEPLYECRLVAQRAAVPVRPLALDEAGLPDPRLAPRPTIRGAQTALVVGAGEPVHTDRDHRIKVQFHWQRGANASHRLDHPAGSNAPATEASGTWVRVAQTVAGANWGAVFTPRVGQEVLVQFVAGDIDRPVVTGVLYNGSGSTDAQGNTVASGAAGSTGNAPAWFPGQKASGAMQGHQHTAVLSGYKSQELAASASGMGGHNQLVFDDSPGAGRIELASTSAATRLQLGHLLHQQDNQRLAWRGHGLDITTAAWGAVRAGSGLLLSAHGKPPSTTSGSSLDSREPRQQLEQSRELVKTLADSAHQHKAKGPGEADQLPNDKALKATIDSLGSTQTREATQGGDDTIGGGAGTVAAWSRPDLTVAAPAGIAAFTPASSVHSAGNTLTVAAGQDIAHLAQANHAAAVKAGIVLFTYGKAQNSQKPNTETGIALHAASGNVNTQSQTAATKLTADKAIEVASTSAMVRVTAPKHVLLTAAGAALDIRAGRITLKGPGKVEFRAASKELGGGASVSTTGVGLGRQGALNLPKRYSQTVNLAGAVGRTVGDQRLRAKLTYRAFDEQGQLLAQGVLDDAGSTEPIFTDTAQKVRLSIGDGHWAKVADAEHGA